MKHYRSIVQTIHVFSDMKVVIASAIRAKVCEPAPDFSSSSDDSGSGSWSNLTFVDFLVVVVVEVVVVVVVAAVVVVTCVTFLTSMLKTSRLNPS